MILQKLNGLRGLAVFAAFVVGALALAGCESAPADTTSKKLLLANYTAAATVETATSLIETGLVDQSTARRLVDAGVAYQAASKAARAAIEACDVVDAAPAGPELIDEDLLRSAMRECNGLTRAMSALESALASYREMVGDARR